MSVIVIERKVDGKRRVVLPPTVAVKEGDTVVMIASKDAAVVASDRAVAQKVSSAIKELEKERKFKVIDEWAKLVEEAGLSGLRAKDIDRLVNEGVSEEVFGRVRNKRSH